MRLGLLAGWGSFPVELTMQARQDGHEVYVIGLGELASEQLSAVGTEFRRMGLLKFGAHTRYFQSRRVQRVMMAGKIFKDKLLFGPGGWMAHLPDLTCLRILGQSFVTKQRDARDDTILTAVVDSYAKKGMDVLPLPDIAPGLLCEAGTLTRRKPSRSTRLDAEFGWKIAKQMGGLDIGQSITIKDQIVLGVEAIEGTDALIDRSAQLCPRGGFTLIKVAKPNQDMRFDVPTIGCRTIERMARAGGKSIVVEAGRTILVERDDTLWLANKHGVSILAKSEQVAQCDGNASEASLRIA